MNTKQEELMQEFSNILERAEKNHTEAYAELTKTDKNSPDRPLKATLESFYNGWLEGVKHMNNTAKHHLL
jgi:hypothetical protein